MTKTVSTTVAETVQADPVGSCIYCGATGEEVDLTKEHVIPLALGGRYILPKSSCKDCATITGRFEARVLRGGLRGIREHLKLESRTKKRPTELPLFDVNGEEGRTEKVAVEDYPALVILPHYRGPTIGNFPNRLISAVEPWYYVPPLALRTLKEKYGIESWSTNAMDSASFARMLAKIAHGFAVATHGLDSFVQFLPEIILDDSPTKLHQFVGTMSAGSEVTGNDLSHHVRVVGETTNEGRYLTCHIRLFEKFGSPSYRVVVGMLHKYTSELPPPITFDDPAPWEVEEACEFKVVIAPEAEREAPWQNIIVPTR